MQKMFPNGDDCGATGPVMLHARAPTLQPGTSSPGGVLLRLVKSAERQDIMTLRDGNGEPLMIDGPFAETKEMLSL